MNIILVGMPGCGKTTAAKRISEELDIQFIDTDSRLEEQYRMPISRIFKLVGEEGFRKIESKVFQEIIKSESNYVMATGGGLPCFYNHTELIKKHGVSFYIKMPPELLTERIFNSRKDRPLTDNKTKEETRDYIEKLLLKREPYYLKANYIYTRAVHDITSFVKEKMRMPKH